LFQSFLRDEAWINTRKGIHKALQDAFQTGNDLWKALQRSLTVQFQSVVSHRLHAKHAFAFGINLQSQLAAVQLEDRQIIRRSLDRHFPIGRPLFAFAISWTTPVSQDGPDGLEIKRRKAAVILKGLAGSGNGVDYNAAEAAIPGPTCIDTQNRGHSLPRK
jgi:hypothetical protein